MDEDPKDLNGHMRDLHRDQFLESGRGRLWGEKESEQFFYRPGEILVRASEGLLADVRGSIERLLDGQCVGTGQFAFDHELALLRFTERPGREAPVIAAKLRERFPKLVISPNHIVFTEQRVSGCPYDFPTPVPAGSMREGKGNDAGAGVMIAVLDTGATDIPQLRAVYPTIPASDLEVVDSDHDGRLDWAAGHGNFIAGICARIAPGAQIVPMRFLGAFGDAPTSRMLKVVDRAIRLAAERECALVLNLSFGTLVGPEDELPLLASSLDRRLARAAHEGVDVIAVCAAGNAPFREPMWPAALESPRVLGVAALDADDPTTPAKWSNSGKWVDLCAVGQQESTFLVAPGARLQGHDTLSGLADAPLDFAGWARWTGTSFAVPQVAALLAVLHAEARYAGRPMSLIDAAQKLIGAGAPLVGGGDNYGVPVTV